MFCIQRNPKTGKNIPRKKADRKKKGFSCKGKEKKKISTQLTTISFLTESAFFPPREHLAPFSRQKKSRRIFLKK